MTYIIGEVGQNHNGSIDAAKNLIKSASREVYEPLFNLKLNPINAVKFTKRDLNYEMSSTMMNQPYLNKNSFGKTYKEHRNFLELSFEDHLELYKYSKSLNLDFIETLCSISCLEILDFFKPDFIKIASRDLTNIPLVEEIAKTNIPMIISTGMAGKKELDDALEKINIYHNDVSILHCVSEYPTHPRNVNLKSINFLQKNYKNNLIGYSDHTIGISVPISAVSMGAAIIEKHITLDRNMKGTDHKGSLGPEGLQRMVRDLRLLEMSLGKEDIFIDESAVNAKVKLARSLSSNKKLEQGHLISENDFHLLSPGDGISWKDRKLLIGKKIKKSINKNETIYLKNTI
jgi:3-deoxy-D-glycero-D-galacto-nononate 9-phosphate synthase